MKTGNNYFEENQAVKFYGNFLHSCVKHSPGYQVGDLEKMKDCS